jgi:hypothetical protein
MEPLVLVALQALRVFQVREEHQESPAKVDFRETVGFQESLERREAQDCRDSSEDLELQEEMVQMVRKGDKETSASQDQPVLPEIRETLVSQALKASTGELAAPGLMGILELLEDQGREERGYANGWQKRQADCYIFLPNHKNNGPSQSQK